MPARVLPVPAARVATLAARAGRAAMAPVMMLLTIVLVGGEGRPSWEPVTDAAVPAITTARFQREVREVRPRNGAQFAGATVSQTKLLVPDGAPRHVHAAA